MTKNNSNKVGKIVLRVGGISGFLIFLLASFVSWNMYDLWGKFIVIEIAAFVFFLFLYLDLTADDPPESQTIYFTHPIAKSIGAILLVLIFALALICILSLFNFHFYYTNFLLFLLIFILDVGSVFVIPKVLHQKFINR